MHCELYTFDLCDLIIQIYSNYAIGSISYENNFIRTNDKKLVMEIRKEFHICRYSSNFMFNQKPFHFMLVYLLQFSGLMILIHYSHIRSFIHTNFGFTSIYIQSTIRANDLHDSWFISRWISSHLFAIFMLDYCLLHIELVAQINRRYINNTESTVSDGTEYGGCGAENNEMVSVEIINEG